MTKRRATSALGLAGIGIGIWMIATLLRPVIYTGSFTPRFGAIGRIDLTYTPDGGCAYVGMPNMKYNPCRHIIRHITDAATIHRFVAAFEQLDTAAAGGGCSLPSGEDATFSFVPVPVHHDWWSRLTGVAVHTQTFHVVYECGRITTDAADASGTFGEDHDPDGNIEIMARQAAMSYRRG